MNIQKKTTLLTVFLLTFARFSQSLTVLLNSQQREFCFEVQKETTEGKQSKQQKTLEMHYDVTG